jgi:hypothetical protein
MRFCCYIYTGLMALLLTPVSEAATVEQIFDRMAQQEAAALQAVDSVLMDTETMGMSQIEYYEKTSKVDVNGQEMYILRQVSPAEMAQRHSAGNAMADASPEELRHAAEVIESQGPEMERGMQEEMQKSGLPAGLGDMLMTPPPDQPWLSSNPKDMTQMYGMMLRGAAEGKEEQARRDADAVDGAHERAQIADRTRLIGRTTIDGRPAFHLLAENINQRQVDDGVELTIRDVNMYVDAEHYVPLLLRMDGTMREGRETREITIERHDQDYRQVPGCGKLYRPFRSEMRMAGVMNAEQEAQMRDAQVQMAQMEKQLAEMPAGQRDMVMRQMGPQMEMMRTMASGGGVQIVSNLNDIKCNVPVPDPMALAQKSFGGGMPGMPGMPASSGSGYPVGAPTGSAMGQADSSSTETPDSRQAARDACLQEKIEAAEAAQKKKRGFGRLVSAAARTASRFGNQDVGRVARDVHAARATADDLAGAARDLGLTEEEIAACDNP